MKNITKLESDCSKSLYEGAQNVRQETGKSLPMSSGSPTDAGLDSRVIQVNSSDLILFTINSQSKMRFMDLNHVQVHVLCSSCAMQFNHVLCSFFEEKVTGCKQGEDPQLVSMRVFLGI